METLQGTTGESMGRSGGQKKLSVGLQWFYMGLYRVCMGLHVGL